MKKLLVLATLCAAALAPSTALANSLDGPDLQAAAATIPAPCAGGWLGQSKDPSPRPLGPNMNFGSYQLTFYPDDSACWTALPDDAKEDFLNQALISMHQVRPNAFYYVARTLVGVNYDSIFELANQRKVVFASTILRTMGVS